MACGRSAWGGEGAAWDEACGKARSVECCSTGVSCGGCDEPEAAGRFDFAYPIALVRIQEPIPNDRYSYNSDTP